MSPPDPDKDILDKLDRRERRGILIVSLVALLAACPCALAVYEIMKSAFGWPLTASRDCAAVVFIMVATGLFLKLTSAR